MTFDLQILRQFGWSEPLIEATRRALEETPAPVAVPMLTAVVDPLVAVATTASIDVRDERPAGTQDIFLF